MAINKNHEFEELNGIKCGIVEKSVLPERVQFLKKLLEYNQYIVEVVPSAPPKAATAAVVKVDEGEIASPVVPLPVTVPETFTVGVSDYTFNPINAIFGRLLHTPDGHVVTQAYWYQKELISHDEVPYYERSNI
jgi:hypothetical protein